MGICFKIFAGWTCQIEASWLVSFKTYKNKFDFHRAVSCDLTVVPLWGAGVIIFWWLIWGQFMFHRFCVTGCRWPWVWMEKKNKPELGQKNQLLGSNRGLIVQLYSQNNPSMLGKSHIGLFLSPHFKRVAFEVTAPRFEKEREGGSTSFGDFWE